MDVDYFRVSDEITGSSQGEESALAATMSATEEISGVINSEAEVNVYLDALTADNHSSLKASISIPEMLTVEDVVFNANAISGNTEYSYKNNRLVLSVTGENVTFTADDKLFATVKCKLNRYVSKDETVSVRADYVMADNGKTDYDVTAAECAIALKYLDTRALAKE